MTTSLTTRQDITVALAEVHPDDWQSVLDYITMIKANKSSQQANISKAQQAYSQQLNLMFELKELYALVNASRLVVSNQGQDETDTAAAVLMQATNRLFDLAEQQAAIEKQLERIAYPESGEEGEV
jgi:hypothetical protein